MTRSSVNWLIALAGPIIILSVYFVLFHATRDHSTGTWDLVAIFVAMAFGLIGILRLEATGTQRLIYVTLYLVFSFMALLAYSLSLVCAAFGECV
jgi:hypothetical protein